MDFVYKFKDLDEREKELCYPLEIPFKDDPEELYHQIVAKEMHPLRKYLDNSGEYFQGGFKVDFRTNLIMFF